MRISARRCSICNCDRGWRGCSARPPSGAALACHVRAGHGRTANSGGRNLSGRHVRTRRSCARRAATIECRRSVAADGQGPRSDPRRRTRVRRGSARVDPSRQLHRPRALDPGAAGTRRRAVRSGRVFAAAGCRRARLQLRQGRSAGHAHGPGQRRKRGAVAGARRRPRDRRCALDLRRGKAEPAHRPGHRRPSRGNPADAHRAVGRSHRVGRSARRAEDPSGDAQLPGHPHLHQPRTRGSRTRPRRGARGAEARWPARSDQFPFAGRPHRQTFHAQARQGAAGQPPDAG